MCVCVCTTVIGLVPSSALWYMLVVVGLVLMLSDDRSSSGNCIFGNEGVCSCNVVAKCQLTLSTSWPQTWWSFWQWPCGGFLSERETERVCTINHFAKSVFFSSSVDCIGLFAFLLWPKFDVILCKFT